MHPCQMLLSIRPSALIIMKGTFRLKDLSKPSSKQKHIFIKQQSIQYTKVGQETINTLAGGISKLKSCKTEYQEISTQYLGVMLHDSKNKCKGRATVELLNSLKKLESGS